MGVDVECGDLGASARQLEAVETGVAADIQHPPACQVWRDERRDLPPLDRWEVAEGMLGRGLRAIGQVQVVKPGRQGGDLGSHTAATPAWLACEGDDPHSHAIRHQLVNVASPAPAPDDRRCDTANTRCRARAPIFRSSVSPGVMQNSSTSAVDRATRISRPGSKNSSRPAHGSVMIGTPHAAASNSRTLGEYPFATMSARVTFNVNRWWL